MGNRRNQGVRDKVRQARDRQGYERAVRRLPGGDPSQAGPGVSVGMLRARGGIERPLHHKELPTRTNDRQRRFMRKTQGAFGNSVAGQWPKNFAKSGWCNLLSATERLRERRNVARALRRRVF